MKHAPIQQSIYHRDNKFTPSPRKASTASVSSSNEKSAFAKILTSKDQQSYAASTANNSPLDGGVQQTEEVKASDPCDPCYIYYSKSIIYDWIAKTFTLEQRSTSVQQEFIAAIASFLTMSYVLLINPQILSKLGIPPEIAVVSTALCSAVGTFIAGYFG